MSRGFDTDADLYTPRNKMAGTNHISVIQTRLLVYNLSYGFVLDIQPYQFEPIATEMMTVSESG